MTKYFLFFLLIIFAAFLETAVVNFNFLLVLVLISAITFPEAAALTLAFFSGVLLDLFSGKTLGLSSLAFILPIFLLILYRQRFSFQNHFVVGLFALISYLVFTLLTGRNLNVFEGVILVILVLLFRIIWPSIFRPTQEQRIVR